VRPTGIDRRVDREYLGGDRDRIGRGGRRCIAQARERGPGIGGPGVGLRRVCLRHVEICERVVGGDPLEGSSGIRSRPRRRNRPQQWRPRSVDFCATSATSRLARSSRRNWSRGQKPSPLALLAIVTLLQKYDELSAGTQSMLRTLTGNGSWCLAPGWRQRSVRGTLVGFRTRAVANHLDQKLLDRTVEVAKWTGKSAGNSCGRAHSSPLHGAGRVEDVESHRSGDGQGGSRR
jgi:hypothetical protein